MKILTFGRLPTGEVGGLPLYTANLAEALVELGHEVHVTNPGPDLEPHHFGFSTSCPRPVTWPSTGKLRNFRQAFGTVKALASGADQFRPDILHVQYGGAMDLAVLPSILKLGARVGAPVVVTAHCGRAWSHLQRLPRLAGRILNRVDRVLVISSDQRELFESAGVAPSRIKQVGSLIEDDFFTRPGPSDLNLAKRASGLRKAVYLGRISPEKGIDTVILALAQVEPHERVAFCATGPVTDTYRTELLRLAEQHGLEDYFSIAPPVSGVDARLAVLDHADLVLHPTLSDVKPLVVIEAMARGIAVLATALPGTVELLAGSGATFPPGDASALAVELRRMCSDPSYLGTGSGRAGREVAAAFRPAVAAAETAAVFEDLRGVLT